MPVPPRTLSLPDEPADDKIALIQPLRGWLSIDLRELWEYRELLYFFTWRDIKVRYKQTLLGASWAILQPFFSMIVFSIFFGRLAKIPSDGIPYPIFSYAGLLPWTFFATGLTNASNSVVRDANLIKRVYFPRLLTPASAVVSGIPDFFFAFLVLAGMMVVYGIYPTAQSLIWLPLFLLLALVTSLGAGLWLAALNAQYRDIRFLVPFLSQFWMYITPVVYPASLLEEPWRTVYGINPMVGVVEGMRWALLSEGSAPGPMTAVSVVAALALAVSGAFYYRRRERIFPDVL